MPQHKNYHSSKYTDIDLKLGSTVPEQRQKKIVSDKAINRHMPATPEKRNIAFKERVIKIFYNSVSEHSCNSNGQVSIPGKIHVNLNGQTINRKYDQRTR